MKYLSICSGIEAASVAWESLGWEPVAFAEIDAFPSAVLKHRFPHVPNLGDISKIDWRPYHGKIDILVGGTPCQSFSVAGKREGLDGASGLVREYFRILEEVRPEWFLWENVPGSFSSNGGKDFEFILREWDKCGYHVSWRVLDAQHFGVPQRRRRIFAVGHLGNWRYPAQVLFEPDCLRGNTPKSGKARKGSAATAEAGSRIDWPARVSSTLNAHFGEKMGLENQHINQGAPLFVPISISTAHTKSNGSGINESGTSYTLEAGTTQAVCAPVVTGTLAASGAGTSRPAGQGNELDFLVPTVYGICSDASNSMKSSNPHSGVYEATTSRTLDLNGGSPCCNQGGMAIVQQLAVRRLTPAECERLQGFPDGWTDIPWRGKEHAPDGPRYKALGNSFAVPVVRWIGERIQSITSPTS